MTRPPIGYQALRAGRVSEAGRVYFITKIARERVPRAATPADALAAGRLVQPGVPEIVLGSLTWLQERALLGLLAYCIMPDHLHLLFALGSGATVPNVLQRFSSFTGLQIYRHTGRGGVWADGYQDRALRAETAVADVVAYIHHNPVRTGLAATAAAWPWSSAADLGDS